MYYWVHVLLTTCTTEHVYYWACVLLSTCTTEYMYYWVRVLLSMCTTNYCWWIHLERELSFHSLQLQCTLLPIHHHFPPERKQIKWPVVQFKSYSIHWQYHLSDNLQKITITTDRNLCITRIVKWSVGTYRCVGKRPANSKTNVKDQQVTSSLQFSMHYFLTNSTLESTMKSTSKISQLKRCNTK